MTNNGLPGNWAMTTVGAVADTIRGVTYKKEQAISTPAPDYVPLLRATNICQVLELSDFVYVPASRVAPEQFIVPGDIVLASSSGSRAVVGKAALLREPWRGAFGAFCMVVRPSTAISPNFLAHYMQTPAYRHRVSELSAGVNINNLRREHVEGIKVPLPPRHEQDRIVGEIEKHLTRLDAAVAALKRVQANLKRYRASVLKAACEGRLVPTEAEVARRQGHEYETAHQWLCRMCHEVHADRHPEPIYVEVPEGWTLVRLKFVSQAIGGYAFKSKDFSEAGYQVIKMANVRAGHLELGNRPSFISSVDEEIASRYALKANDVVITLTGTRKKRDYGYAAVVGDHQNLLLNQRLARLRPIEGLNPKFLKLILQDERFRNRFFSHETGNVGQGNVGIAAVTQECILVAPVAEQLRISEEFERQMSIVESVEELLDHNLKTADRLRRSILKRAFEGKLVPQDPNDEPASVLLERISAERTKPTESRPKKRVRAASAKAGEV